jgi:hypothetical protein
MSERANELVKGVEDANERLVDLIERVIGMLPPDERTALRLLLTIELMNVSINMHSLKLRLEILCQQAERKV